MTGAVAPLLLAAALPEEAAAVKRRLAGPRRVSGLDCRAWRGLLAGREVVVAETGDGADRAGECLREVLSAARYSGVVGFGVAGGLTSDLAAGDVVVAHRVLGGGGFASRPDAGLLRAAVEAGARGVTAVTVPAVALTAADKRALATTLAVAGAIVDLESAAWAAAAERSGLPWVVLRAVADAHDEDLPAILRRCVRPDGTVGRSRVAAAALTRPGSLPALLRLGERVRWASGRLAPILEGMMVRGPLEARGTASREAV